MRRCQGDEDDVLVAGAKGERGAAVNKDRVKERKQKQGFHIPVDTGLETPNSLSSMKQAQSSSSS